MLRPVRKKLFNFLDGRGMQNVFVSGVLEFSRLLVVNISSSSLDEAGVESIHQVLLMCMRYLL